MTYYSQNINVVAHVPPEFQAKPCRCLVCRGSFDIAQLKKCPDCDDPHVCPVCGQGDWDLFAFLFEPVVIVDTEDAAAHVRATVWGRAN